MKALLSATLVGGVLGYGLSGAYSPVTLQRSVADYLAGLQRSAQSFVTGTHYETLTIFDVEEVERRRAERARLLGGRSI